MSKHRRGGIRGNGAVNIAVFAIVGGLVWWLFWNPVITKTSPSPPQLIVFLDVSMSQAQEEIKSGVTRAFQYIRSSHLPDGSKYRLYVADGDPATKLIGDYEKPKAADSTSIQLQRDNLQKAETAVSQQVDDYIQKHSKRIKTCLVQALSTAPSLFGTTPSTDLRVLLVSDMIEDCTESPEPKDEKMLSEELKASAGLWSLGDLRKYEILAAVAGNRDREEKLTVAQLRTAWHDLLEPANPKSFRLDTMDQFVRFAQRPQNGM